MLKQRNHPSPTMLSFHPSPGDSTTFHSRPHVTTQMTDVTQPGALMTQVVSMTLRTTPQRLHIWTPHQSVRTEGAPWRRNVFKSLQASPVALDSTFFG